MQLSYHSEFDPLQRQNLDATTGMEVVKSALSLDPNGSSTGSLRNHKEVSFSLPQQVLGPTNMPLSEHPVGGPSSGTHDGTVASVDPHRREQAITNPAAMSTAPQRSLPRQTSSERIIIKTNETPSKRVSTGECWICKKYCGRYCPTKNIGVERTQPDSRNAT